MALAGIGCLCTQRRAIFAALSITVFTLFGCAESERVASDGAPSSYAASSSYAVQWGPSIGSTVPMLSALDQDGKQQDLASLKGAKGLLFVFNRSVDW